MASSEPRARTAERRYRSVYFGPDVGRVEVEVKRREDITGDWTRGPLIVEEYDSNTVVPPWAQIRRIDWNMLEMQIDTVEGV